jgi:hypothetical protein
VCGSHELAHFRCARGGRIARTVDELVLFTAERRGGVDRRAGSSDELAAMLAEAFAPDRVRSGERRRAN